VNVKTYQAYTMAEALSAVKEDLGQDALILHTRTFKRGGVLGVGARSVVEVTATPNDERPPADPRPPTAAAEPTPTQMLADADRKGDLMEMLRGLAEVATPPVPPTPAAPAPVPAPVQQPAPAPAPEPEPEPPPTPPQPTASVAQRFVLQPPRDDPPRDPPRLPVTEKLQEELVAIREMVGEVLRGQEQVAPKTEPDDTPQAPPQSRPQTGPTLPPELLDIHLKLVTQGLSDELAERVLSKIDTSEVDDIDAAVVRELACLVQVVDDETPASSPDGRPLMVALVGPTGVGKTTTVAKLAATYKLHHGRRVGMITADTYRIAAVEQLRTYAEIIGVPLQVALSPADMLQCVQTLSDCEVVLIDTAGRSQNDPARIDELRKFVSAADPHEVHLVLSSTASEKVLLQEAEVFAAVGVDRLVLTKLDEAAGFGSLIMVAHQVGCPLSYLTTGQEVPDHIEPARSTRLAELVMEGSFETCRS
jgi:flagellar biosynthesis protein FlhF